MGSALASLLKPLQEHAVDMRDSHVTIKHSHGILLAKDSTAACTLAEVLHGRAPRGGIRADLHSV